MSIAKLFCALTLIIVALLGAAKAEILPAKSGMDESGNVVLVSNARVAVTKADFEAEIERVPEQDRFEFLASRERIGKVLEEILLRKTLASEALESGLDKLPGTIKRLAAARERVLATEMMQSLGKNAKTPDFELRAKEIYRVNPDKYTVKPTVRASHILVNFKDRSKDEALKRAQEVHTLATGGDDFGALASKYSDDGGSKAEKGDLGYFSADMMVKPFSDAAFALKPGEISAPVETQFGFHVIKVNEVKPGFKQDYAAVKANIIEELNSEYSEGLKKDHLIQIRTDKTIKIDEAEIAKIKSVLPSVGKE